MPIVDFSRVSNLFREKSYQNIDSVPATATTSAESIAADSKGADGINTRSKPTSTQPRGLNDRQSTVFDQARMRTAYAGNTGGDSRVGFTLTSDLWMAEGKALQLHAGPSAVSWTLALRAQNEENKAGHARYAQARTALHGTGEAANPNPVFFDFAKLSFQFQAGNLIPIQGFRNEVTVPYGLQDFYSFMELLNQPPILPSGPNEGKHNYVWVFYTSLQFPQMTIKGYFDPEGVSWEDSAEAPTTLQWTAGFLAHDMTPNPWEREELFSAYTDFMRDTVRVF